MGHGRVPLTRTLLIDGDTLVFESAASVEYETEWDDGLWTLHSNLDAGMLKLKESIEEIIEKLKATSVIIALSDDTRWRNSVMPTYKQNRKKTRKPLIYTPLREWVHESYETYQRPGLEGDDVLGILATHPTLIPGDQKVIVSIDKDLQTIPGLLFNYKKAREQSGDWGKLVREVTEAEADRYHLFQTLTGDTTDGYPGCPGIGPVSAEKVLGDDPSWAKVIEAYKKAKLGEGAALQQARVARILRHTDYNFKKKEVILWNPPAE